MASSIVDEPVIFADMFPTYWQYRLLYLKALAVPFRLPNRRRRDPAPTCDG